MPRAWPNLSIALLPYARMELPGWGKLLRVAGVSEPGGWEGAPMRTVRGKSHGYLMELDLSDWSERLSYFLGRYHEVPTELFFNAVVGPGETFIDIGGNIGMVTLLAAGLVGPAGRVHTFEPNPILVKRLTKLIAVNHLDHVTLHGVGLSDQPGELTLRVLANHPGQGTLAQVAQADQAAITQEYHVGVRVGDDELPADLPGPATMKLDVEGYELHALRGLHRTLTRLRPIVFTEVGPEGLLRAGTSVEALFEFMHDLGYQAYSVATVRRAMRYALRLNPASGPAQVTAENVAWLDPKSPRFAKVAQFVG